MGLDASAFRAGTQQASRHVTPRARINNRIATPAKSASSGCRDLPHVVCLQCDRDEPAARRAVLGERMPDDGCDAVDVLSRLRTVTPVAGPLISVMRD